MSSCSPYSRLISLANELFPNIKAPIIEYEVTTDISGEANHKASIRLLGQHFSSPSFTSQEEATDYICNITIEVLREFDRLIISKSSQNNRNEPLFSVVQSLKSEAEKVCQSPNHMALNLVSNIKNRLIDAENEQIEKKVKVKAEMIQDKMMKINKPEIESTSMKRGIQPSEESLAKVNAEPLLKKLNRESSGPINIGAPIPAFFEFAEKQASKESIIFDDFVKGNNFGCRIVWGKNFWVAPAIHRQKKDAHNYAAVLACVQLFGEGFVYEGIDPDLYRDWTRESVRAASDKYSFATSDELLHAGPGAFSEVDDSDVLFDFSDIKIEPLSDGKKFLSVVNEICQKMRYTPPNYIVSSVNSLTNYYFCSVKNFHKLPHIESSPFTKKNDAKEDAAGKIYHLLKMRGIVDEASRVIGTRFRSPGMINSSLTVNSTDSGTNSEIRNISQPLNPNSNQTSGLAAPSIPPPPQSPLPSPVMNMNNEFMNPMLQMFIMSQMMQNQNNSISNNPQSNLHMPANFEAMMEMTRQWQAFLAWQHQNLRKEDEKLEQDENKKSKKS